MKILPVCLLVACVVLARAQDDGEARPAARGILKRGQLPKGKTTTTTPAPQEEVDYEDDEYAEGEGQEASTEAPTSTTEGKRMVGTGVRPFRSNTDLLELLKRKRAQAAEAKLHGPASTTTSSPAQDSIDPVKSNYSNNKNKKRFNNAPVTREVASEDAPAPPKPSRGRFGRPATRSVVQEPEEEVNDAAPAARNTRTFRRGGN